jgi:S-adenosyl-L-methionine hydrolase (adenosine-forming)
MVTIDNLRQETSMKKLLLGFLILLTLVPLAACSSSGKPGKPVVLLTDYGADDYRVPAMKGVIYNTLPGVEIIDATHGIPGMDVAAGAYVLELAAKEFPADVVFIAGVGSPTVQDARYIVLLTNKGQIFVAPNNGLLTYVIQDMGVKQLYSVTNNALYDRPDNLLSSHYILGRIGALIASGRQLKDLGPQINSPVMLDVQTASIADGRLKGAVVFIDHFGSCLTNITAEDCSKLGMVVGGSIRLLLGGGTEVMMKVGTTYGSVAKGEAVAFVNSLGVLQLSLNSASFAAAYNLNNGTNIDITAAE